DRQPTRLHPIRKRDIVWRFQINDVGHHRVQGPLHVWFLRWLCYLLPSAALISRAFSASAVATRSSSAWYFSAGMLSFNRRRFSISRSRPCRSTYNARSLGSFGRPAPAALNDRIPATLPSVLTLPSLPATPGA